MFDLPRPTPKGLAKFVTMALGRGFFMIIEHKLIAANWPILHWSRLKRGRLKLKA
jgi:hypothetical protein